jgi:hypothetical protein
VQMVDVAVEGFGVLAEQRDHRALDGRAVRAPQRRRDSVQRVAAGDLVGRAAGDGRRSCRRRRGLQSRSRLGRDGLAGCGRLRGDRRCHRRGRRTLGRREQRRRVEQHRVLAEQAPARPVHIDEKGYEGLADGVARAHHEDAATVPAAPHAEIDRGQERRAVQPVTGEDFRRGEMRVEGGKLLRRRGDQVDFSGERLVERRIEADLAETEAEGRRRCQQNRRNEDAQFPAHHDSPRLRRTKLWPRTCELGVKPVTSP